MLDPNSDDWAQQWRRYVRKFLEGSDANGVRNRGRLLASILDQARWRRFNPGKIEEAANGWARRLRAGGLTVQPQQLTQLWRDWADCVRQAPGESEIWPEGSDFLFGLSCDFLDDGSRAGSALGRFIEDVAEKNGSPFECVARGIANNHPDNSVWGAIALRGSSHVVNCLRLAPSESNEIGVRHAELLSAHFRALQGRNDAARTEDDESGRRVDSEEAEIAPDAESDGPTRWSTECSGWLARSWSEATGAPASATGPVETISAAISSDPNFESWRVFLEIARLEAAGIEPELSCSPPLDGEDASTQLGGWLTAQHSRLDEDRRSAFVETIMIGGTPTTEHWNSIGITRGWDPNKIGSVSKQFERFRKRHPMVSVLMHRRRSSQHEPESRAKSLRSPHFVYRGLGVLLARRRLSEAESKLLAAFSADTAAMLFYTRLTAWLPVRSQMPPEEAMGVDDLAAAIATLPAFNGPRLCAEGGEAGARQAPGADDVEALVSVFGIDMAQL